MQLLKPASIVLVIVVVVIVVLTKLCPQSSLSTASNVAQVIQALVEVCLLIYVVVFAKELRESIAARHLDGMKYVREIILTPDAVELRKWVYQGLPHESRPLSDDAIEKVRRIGRDFDHIGLLCRKGLLPADIIATTYNRNITAMWNGLRQPISDLRITDKDNDYLAEFQWLAKLASQKEATLQEAALRAQDPKW